MTKTHNHLFHPQTKPVRQKWPQGALAFHFLSFLTEGMNLHSNKWENGPWPRSWQRPAIWTHRTSLSVMSRWGCLFRSALTSSPAKWHTLKTTGRYVISLRHSMASWSSTLNSSRQLCVWLACLLLQILGMILTTTLNSRVMSLIQNNFHNTHPKQ